MNVAEQLVQMLQMQQQLLSAIGASVESFFGGWEEIASHSQRRQQQRQQRVQR